MAVLLRKECVAHLLQRNICILRAKAFEGDRKRELNVTRQRGPQSIGCRPKPRDAPLPLVVSNPSRTRDAAQCCTPFDRSCDWGVVRDDCWLRARDTWIP